MADQIALDTTTRRYEAFSAWRTLTAPLFLAIALLGIIVVAGLTLAVSLNWLELTELIWGISLVSGGMTGALFLLFFFATTYLDAASRHSSAASLTARAAFEVLAILRRAGAARQAEEVSLLTMVGSLSTSPAGEQLLRRLQLEAASLLHHLETVADILSNEAIIAKAFELVQSTEDRMVEVEHLLGATLLQPVCAEWLRAHDLQDDDILFTIWWRRVERQAAAQDRQWWVPERLLSLAGLGRSFAAGFTPLVDQFSRIPAGNLWDIVNEGHEELVQQLILTLARARQSNALLVGQPGVGRLGIIQELARRVRAQRAHPALDGQRLVYLHVGELLAQGTTTASQLATVSQVLSEVERAGNIIAVIDGLSSLLAEEGEHKLDMTAVLLPFFSSLTVRVVVIISSDEYHVHLKTNEELIHFFEVIQVPPSNERVTLRSLARASRFIENNHQVVIPYQALEALVRGTSGILQHIPYPERAFDVLEEAIVVAQTRIDRTVTPDIVEQLIANKVGIPVRKLQQKERQYLLDLEERMHQRLVNQDHAIAALARAMVRARAGVRNIARPIGTFLFLGPTGVGKTEAAKTLADAYFGSETYLSRLDMSEFQTPEAVGILVGTATHPVGRLTSLISDTPFTIVLLDEFEKAHTGVKQLFLQVLDEGRLTDARGQTASFQHSIIIATSNAGAVLIREEVKDGELPEGFSARLQDYLMAKGIFSPELLNRFDGVITFAPLAPRHLQQIAHNMLVRLNSRLDAQHGITVAITPELIDYVVAIGYSPEFGARPLQRAIQDTVEYAVAQDIIAGRTHPGQTIHLTPQLLGAQRQR